MSIFGEIVVWGLVNNRIKELEGNEMGKVEGEERI